MNGVTEIREEAFDTEVLKATTPVLVDFFAPWCGPCRMLAPALEGIAKTYGERLKVVKVNVDNAAGLAGTFRIRGVPTLMLFKNGEAVDTIVGIPSANLLSQKLDAVLRVNTCA